MRSHGPPRTYLIMTLVGIVLTACKPDAKVEAPEIRPVRTVTATKGEAGEIVVLTGHVQAQDEPALAFRIGGRMIERPVTVGDRVEAGQVLAKLDPENELNTLRSAEAALVAAQGQALTYCTVRGLSGYRQVCRGRASVPRGRCEGAYWLFRGESDLKLHHCVEVAIERVLTTVVFNPCHCISKVITNASADHGMFTEIGAG